MPVAFDPIISENFNGGEVFSVDPVLLAKNQLSKAINVRFKLGGGFTNRPGFEEKVMAHFTSIGTGPIQGMYATENEVYIAVNGKIFVGISDNLANDSFELYSGLSTTADVEFLEFNGDIYVMNGVDFSVRIARTTTDTALTAGVSVSLDIASGQTWRFPATGTFRVISSLGFDDITVTGTASNTLTITAATVGYSHPSGSLIFYITSLSSAPKFGFGAEFINTWWAAGNPGETGQKYQGNTLFYSRTASGLNPEYFYDFAGAGSGFIPVGDKSDITALLKTKTYLLIFKKSAIYYCDGFTSSIPNIRPLAITYGAAGKRCVASIGDQVVTYTGKSIKTVGEQEGLSNAVPSVNPQFDDKILKKLVEFDQDQSDAVLHFNPDQKLLKLSALQGGARVMFVLDTNIQDQPWSRDTGKTWSCACTFKGETFWGSDTEPKVYQDEVGYDDNGIAIRSEVKLADFNAGSTRVSKYFKTQFLRGLLGENTMITVKIYFDDAVIQQFTIEDDLITVSGGSPIGRAIIGGGITVSTESAALGYPWELERLLKKRRNTGRMSVEFIVDGTGQIFEIASQEINGYYSAKFDRKIRS